MECVKADIDFQEQDGKCKRLSNHPLLSYIVQSHGTISGIGVNCSSYMDKSCCGITRVEMVKWQYMWVTVWKDPTPLYRLFLCDVDGSFMLLTNQFSSVQNQPLTVRTKEPAWISSEMFLT